MNVSIVIAAYNEEAVIEENLQRVIDTLNSRPAITWEVICVNDGSTDGTGAILDRFSERIPHARVIHHRRNFGQGRALRTAFDQCKGNVIVTLDADLSYGPEYIFKLIDALKQENVEIVLASPYVCGGSVRNIPFHRHFLSRFGNLYLGKMLPYSISTSTCVVRAYRREVIDSLILTSDGMEIQLEILTKSAIMGYRVQEISAHLEWAFEKAAGSNISRKSKLDVLKTIRLYLTIGLLSRPALFFIFLSLLMILPGSYMGFILFYRLSTYVIGNYSFGISNAISMSLNQLFANYTYSVVICGVLLMIGIQVFAFALILLQSKAYFEEMCRMSQRMWLFQKEGRLSNYPDSK